MSWISSLLHGLNKQITGKDRFKASKIQLVGIPLPLNLVASFWDDAGDAAEGLLRGQLDIPGFKTLKIHSFSTHIVLMALAPTSVWKQADFEATAMAVNHHFAVLTYALAHKTKPDLFRFGDIEIILDRCPEGGPRSDLPAKTGWQRDNRWIRSRDIDKAGKGHRAYNGVDFLMLHNLAHIVFSR